MLRGAHDVMSCCVWNAASWCDHLRNCVGIELTSDLEAKLLLVSDESQLEPAIKFICEESVVLPWKIPKTR